MAKYIKKPVIIDALQYTRYLKVNEVRDWVESFGDIYKDYFYITEDFELKIKTLEGDHLVSENDYIIRGIVGKYYPCKPDIFFKTYDKVNEL